MEERRKYAWPDNSGSWKRRHTGDRHGRVRKISRKESMVIKTKVEKRIYQPGSDGCIMKCYSCGSFRRLLDKCPDSWENLEKKSSNSRSKPVEYGYGGQMNSETGQSSSIDIEQLTHELASLNEENEILKCEIRRVEAENCKQLRRKANHYEKILSPKQELDRDTGASVQSKMVEMNPRTRNEKQKQSWKTETASLQTEKLMMTKMAGEIAGDVCLLKKQNETLSMKQKELENMLSAHQDEKLSSILKNQMSITRTHDIENVRDNANRLKKLDPVEAAQKHEKENQPERSTGRFSLVSNWKRCTWIMKTGSGESTKVNMEKEK